ncbi:MAG: ATP-grasp domain-containing protein [bacterium]
MKKTNLIDKHQIAIAVSGVGGGVGQSVVKALANSNYKIIGLDGETLGTGLYVVPEAYVIPYANDPAFLSRVREICAEQKCKLFFPGMDVELAVLARSRRAFQEVGTFVVVSNPEVIEICDDKLLTYEFLSKNNIPAPFTAELNDLLNQKAEIPFPLIIKPKKGGARSKNVRMISSRLEIEHMLYNKNFDKDNYVAQEYLDGDEYTCGSVSFDGNCFGVIVMKRILRDGDTYKCFVERNALINETVERIIKALKPTGGCNVQLRMKNGIPYVFEINARCSGTTAARALAGFNEPLMIADYLIRGKKPSFSIKEISILRYWKELVVDGDAIRALETNGRLSNLKWAQL